MSVWDFISGKKRSPIDHGFRSNQKNHFEDTYEPQPIEISKEVVDAAIERQRIATRNRLKEKIKDFENRFEGFRFEITSFQNNSIKIVKGNTLDIFPTAEISKVRLSKGKRPHISEKEFLFEVYRDGAYYRHYRNSWDYEERYVYPTFKGREVIDATDDTIEVKMKDGTITSFIVPAGLGEGYVEKFQKIMADVA